MDVRFWGVRGSIPCPGPETVKYGGNTACLEIGFEDLDRLIIIDAGSGIRELGNHIMANNFRKGPIKAEIFLTHTHWDHIQGFPFFTPIYLPNTEIQIYGPSTFEGDTLEDVLGGQLVYRYFPVSQTELASDIRYHHLTEGAYDLGDGIMLYTKFLNHPLLCLGYRFEYRNTVFCTSYDTEPFRNLFSTRMDDPIHDEDLAQEAEQVAREENERIEAFFTGADLLVHDTQYTREEHESSKLGWGHSSVEHAIAAAGRSGVRRLALFHHEPTRSDAQIDSLSQRFCTLENTGGKLEAFFAKEGMKIKINSKGCGDIREKEPYALSAEMRGGSLEKASHRIPGDPGMDIQKEPRGKSRTMGARASEVDHGTF